MSATALLELTRAVLDRHIPFRFRAGGQSMWPFIRHGDVLTIAPLNGVAPRLGDVVALLLPETGKMAVHRVVGGGNGAFLLRGDGASEPDGLVPRADIVGRVARVERNGREVRLGLGPERHVVALLSRCGWSWQLLHDIETPLRLVLRQAQSIAVYRRLARRACRQVVIREACADDMRRVQAWLAEGEPVPAVAGPDVTSFVAEHRGQLAGLVQLVVHSPDHAPYVGHWLFSLVVRERYRGSGIGEALSQAVMSKAKTERARSLLLLVYADNLPAIRLYRKLGFRKSTLPELEPQLEQEEHQSGRRRIVMQADLH